MRAFISAFDAAAEDCGEHGATVLLVGHPPKTDAKFSGSTDWRNGVRGMLLIEWLDVTVDVKHGKNEEAVGYEIAKVPVGAGGAPPRTGTPPGARGDRRGDAVPAFFAGGEWSRRCALAVRRPRRGPPP